MSTNDGFRDKAINDITEERNRQIKLGWTTEHDDHHRNAGWAALVDDYNFHHMMAPEENEASFRDDMVKIAALALAAIESFDRQGNKGAS